MKPESGHSVCKAGFVQSVEDAEVMLPAVELYPGTEFTTMRPDTLYAERVVRRRLSVALVLRWSGAAKIGAAVVQRIPAGMLCMVEPLDTKDFTRQDHRLVLLVPKGFGAGNDDVPSVTDGRIPVISELVGVLWRDKGHKALS